MTTKALVVLSGGQDSTTCLFHAVSHHGPENVRTLTFGYGQRHAREIEAAEVVARLAGVTGDRQETVMLPPGTLSGTSPLTDLSQPLEQYADATTMAEVIGDRVEKTFVPMRNALFLTLAANRAVVHGCRTIYTGVCQEDNANYPDCREEFIDAQELAINTALGNNKTGNGITVVTPLMYMSKADSIRFAMGIPNAYEALAWSHTAYDGAFPPVGHDHATLLRAQGFEEAYLPDPLVVRAYMLGLMDLPNTKNYTRGMVDVAMERIGQLAKERGLAL